MKHYFCKFKVLNCDVINGVQTVTHRLKQIPKSLVYRSSIHWTAKSGRSLRVVFQAFLVDRGFWTKKYAQIGNIDRAADQAVLHAHQRVHIGWYTLCLSIALISH